MRIRITGEKTLITSLEQALSADRSVRTEHVHNEPDHTELAFAVAEFATIIAAVNGAAKLVEYMVTLARHAKPGSSQKLQLKSSVGTITIDLRKDVSPQELEHLLHNLEPQP